MSSIDNEFREWLRLEEGDDETLSSLLITSKAIIKKATGVTLEKVKDDPDGIEVYKTIQKILITRLYENRESKQDIDNGLISMYMTLKTLVEDLGDK